MKTNKSVKKRFKISKRGKILVRKSGHGHFNAKKRRVRQLEIKRLTRMTLSKKELGQYLPTH